MPSKQNKKSTTDYMISLMLLHAEHQGFTKNYVCEQSGVDLRKYIDNGHKPSLRTLESYCDMMNLSVASLIMVAEFAFKKQVTEPELVKWIENWQRFQEVINVGCELQLKEL
jgi:hypothetical protein